MWLRLIGSRMASSWLLKQVVLHRDWGRHVPTLGVAGMNSHVIWQQDKQSNNLGEFSCAS